MGENAVVKDSDMAAQHNRGERKMLTWRKDHRMQHPAGLQGKGDEWLRQRLNASLLIKRNTRGKARLKSQWPARSKGKCVTVHAHAWYNRHWPGHRCTGLQPHPWHLNR